MKKQINEIIKEVEEEMPEITWELDDARLNIEIYKHINKIGLK